MSTSGSHLHFGLDIQLSRANLHYDFISVGLLDSLHMAMTSLLQSIHGHKGELGWRMHAHCTILFVLFFHRSLFFTRRVGLCFPFVVNHAVHGERSVGAAYPACFVPQYYSPVYLAWLRHAFIYSISFSFLITRMTSYRWHSVMRLHLLVTSSQWEKSCSGRVSLVGKKWCEVWNECQIDCALAFPASPHRQINGRGAHSR